MLFNDGKKKDNDTVLSLMYEVYQTVLSRLVSELPVAIHSTADRLIFIYDNAWCPVVKGYQQIPFHDYILTASVTAGLFYCTKRWFTRIRNATEIPLEWYGGKKRLSGWCVAVTDSDNIRVYHTPTIFHSIQRRLLTKTKRLETINVRLAGIDAPEVILMSFMH